VTRVHNFSAGPAALPEAVLRQAAEEMLDWHGRGMSIMEMSHRTPDFEGVIAAAEADLRELMGIPANYKVLFLQGGATLQFSAVPINLLRGKQKADYIVTGSWSEKAVAEGRRFCDVNIAASTEAANFTYALSCMSAPMKPSWGSSSPMCRKLATCLWWPTCHRTFCRAKSMSRNTR
jgi:phosphoserine aminotransferase